MFAVPTLRCLFDADYEIIRVYTQPPRPAGRGQSVCRSDVHHEAERLGLSVVTTASVNREQEILGFEELAPDICVVVAFGQILSEGILNVPRLGCLNLHASLLPRWRGAAPIRGARRGGIGTERPC